MTYNVNGRLIELEEGSGILVNSYQLHYGFSAEHNECEFVCILLSPELLQVNNWFYQNCIEPFTENSTYPYLYLSRNGWMASIMEKLEEIYDFFGKSPAEASDLSSLRSMMTYIEEHYMEHITLADIALSGACCKSKCALLFKKYLHDTPITYTTKLRLRKSLSTLLDSNSNIAAIAYEYGLHHVNIIFLKAKNFPSNFCYQAARPACGNDRPPHMAAFSIAAAAFVSFLIFLKY